MLEPRKEKGRRAPAWKKVLEETLAVVVLYKTELRASETFQTLTADLERQGATMDLLVYDNSPVRACTEEEIRERAPWNIYYRHDPSNPGVSKAYNEGWKHARRTGKTNLLLLDQDTAFPAGTLRTYATAALAYPRCPLFAPVLWSSGKVYSPCRYLLKRGIPMKQATYGLQRLEGKGILNSGLFIRASTFAQAGGYDERVRLDFSDFAFIERLNRVIDTFYVLPIEARHAHSSTVRDLERALFRYDAYCEGIRYLERSGLEKMSVPLLAGLRGAKLSASYKSLRFMHIFYRHFLGI